MKQGFSDDFTQIQGFSEKYITIHGFPDVPGGSYKTKGSCPNHDHLSGRPWAR